MNVRLRVIAAAALASSAACAGVPHAVDDLKCVHGSPVGNTLIHQYEVERYTWLAAQARWGWASFIPQLGEQTKRSRESLDDPWSFCFDRLDALQHADLDDRLENSEAIHWAGAIANYDPFSLCRIKALRVVGRIVKGAKPDIAILQSAGGDYATRADRMLQRLEKLHDLSQRGALTATDRDDYVSTVKDVASIGYPISGNTRSIGDYLARLYGYETDVTIREALSTYARYLLVRGSLQALDAALLDGNERVRIEAVRVYCDALGSACMPRLAEKLDRDGSEAVRAEMAHEAGKLAKTGVPEEDPPSKLLLALAFDDAQAVSVSAMDELGRLTGLGAHYDAAYWRKWQADRMLRRTGAASQGAAR